MNIGGKARGWYENHIGPSPKGLRSSKLYKPEDSPLVVVKKIDGLINCPFKGVLVLGYL